MDQDASLYNGSGVFYRLAIAQQRGAEDMAAQAADGGGPPGERHNREIDACMAVLTFLQAALETHIFWVYRLAGLEARRQWRLKWTDVGAVAVAKGLPDVALPGEHAETLNEISDWRNYLLHGDDEARRRLASRLDTSGDPVPHQHLSAAYTADRPRIYVWAWRQER